MIIYLRKYLVYTIIIVITGGVCLLICSLIKVGIVADPIIKIVICTIIPNLFFYICFRKKAEFQMLKEKIISIFLILLNTITRRGVK